MVVPAAMNIESAIDTLKDVPEWVRKDQQKEFQSAMGADTCKRLGLAFPLSDEAKRGYELGIQTARVMIFSSMEIRLKGADPQNVL